MNERERRMIVGTPQLYNEFYNQAQACSGQEVGNGFTVEIKTKKQLTKESKMENIATLTLGFKKRDIESNIQYIQQQIDREKENYEFKIKDFKNRLNVSKKELSQINKAIKLTGKL